MFLILHILLIVSILFNKYLRDWNRKVFHTVAVFERITNVILDTVFP